MSAFVIIKNSLFCLVIECTGIRAKSQENKSSQRSIAYKSDLLHGSFPRFPHPPPSSYPLETAAISGRVSIRQHRPPASLCQYPLVPISHRFFSYECVDRDWYSASPPGSIPTTQRFLFSALLRTRQ